MLIRRGIKAHGRRTVGFVAKPEGRKGPRRPTPAAAMPGPLRWAMRPSRDKTGIPARGCPAGPSRLLLRGCVNLERQAPVACLAAKQDVVSSGLDVLVEVHHVPRAVAAAAVVELLRRRQGVSPDEDPAVAAPETHSRFSLSLVRAFMILFSLCVPIAFRNRRTIHQSPCHKSAPKREGGGACEYKWPFTKRLGAQQCRCLACCSVLQRVPWARQVGNITHRCPAVRVMRHAYGGAGGRRLPTAGEVRRGRRQGADGAFSGAGRRYGRPAS